MDPLDTMKAMSEIWSRSAHSFLDAQRNLFGSISAAAPGLLTPTGVVPDMEAATAAQAAFIQAWSTADSISKTFAASLGGGRGSDPLATDLLAKIFDPRGWMASTSELDETLNRMAEGPRLADLWNVERKFSALFTAWIALRRRNLEHNTVMLEAWTRATGEFAKALNARAEAGTPLESARELMSLWVETANDVLLDVQRSDGFLASQRETLKASTDLRLAQQDVGEFYSRMFGYPTRAELDDVHRSLTELRREVRARRRAARARRAKLEASTL